MHLVSIVLRDKEKPEEGGLWIFFYVISRKKKVEEELVKIVTGTLADAFSSQNSWKKASDFVKSIPFVNALMEKLSDESGLGEDFLSSLPLFFDTSMNIHEIKNIQLGRFWKVVLYDRKRKEVAVGAVDCVAVKHGRNISSIYRKMVVPFIMPVAVVSFMVSCLAATLKGPLPEVLSTLPEEEQRKLLYIVLDVWQKVLMRVPVRVEFKTKDVDAVISVYPPSK